MARFDEGWTRDWADELARRFGFADYQHYLSEKFPGVLYDPETMHVSRMYKIPILPPGTKINFVAWDQVGHVPISTMADWEPGCAVSVAVAESDPNPWACRYVRSSPLRTWAGAFNPDMHNLKRAMATPPTFFDGPLGVPFDPAQYDKDHWAVKLKTYRYPDWKSAGFMDLSDVEEHMRRTSATIRRRLNAAAIAHLIVAPAIEPADYDPLTISDKLRTWSDDDYVCDLTPIYDPDTMSVSAPPVDLDDFDTVLHEN